MWENRVTLGKSGILDSVNGAYGFEPGQDDEFQLLWLMQLCNPKDDVPEPAMTDKGNDIPQPVLKELLQSNDPNEKSGTQGGGAAARGALRHAAALRRRVPEPAERQRGGADRARGRSARPDARSTCRRSRSARSRSGTSC